MGSLGFRHTKKVWKVPHRGLSGLEEFWGDLNQARVSTGILDSPLLSKL